MKERGHFEDVGLGWRMEFTEIEWEDVDCINLVQGRENLLAVLNVWNFLTS